MREAKQAQRDATSDDEDEARRLQTLSKQRAREQGTTFGFLSAADLLNAPG